MNTILEIELPETFICSNCGELPIDRFTEGQVKCQMKRHRKTTWCVDCRNDIDKKRRNKLSFLSQKYLLPADWFKQNSLERGMISEMTKSGNRRSDTNIKKEDLWQLYCCHVYLHGRIDAYTKKEFQYFYSDNMTRVLNEYMPSLDHIVPLDNFGENTISNVTFTTYNFNLRKGKTSLQNYYEKLILDNGLSPNAKPDVDGILAQINNTYQFYLKHRGTAKMRDIEQYVLDSSPYKHIENEIKGLNLDMGY